MNDFNAHRDREYRVIMTGIGVVGGLGLTCSMLPAVEHATTLILVGLGALAVVVVAVRLAARAVREYREDRVDELIGAAWRARHMPTPAHRPESVGSGSGLREVA